MAARGAYLCRMSDPIPSTTPRRIPAHRCDPEARLRVVQGVEPTDGALARRVQDGDEDAFRILVDRYYLRCARYATRMLGNRADAEDVVQETFVRAYRAMGRYREDGRFQGWLFRILVNRCRSYAARRQRERERTVPDPGPLPAHPRHGEAVAWRDEIGRALETLAPTLREAFLLKYVEEHSYEEMAELTGARISALKMRVKRARDELQTLLGDVYHDG